jgi:two-component system cell cycle response regulator
MRVENKIIETLRATEEQVRILIANNPDGILVVDTEGIVRFANGAAEQLFGRRADELQGKPFGFPLSADESTEIEIIHRTNKINIVEMRVANIPWEGKDSFLASLRDITIRKQLEKELQDLSIKDQLTGLYNRRGFLTLAEQQLKMSARSGNGLLLIFADLDGMKWINDKLGHKKGDEALRETAKILSDTFREADIIARMGGDEFAVLAVETSTQDPAILRDRLQQEIDIHNAAEDTEYLISLSIGIAFFDPENPSSMDDLLSRADEEMYLEKRGKSSRGAMKGAA